MYIWVNVAKCTRVGFIKTITMYYSIACNVDISLTSVRVYNVLVIRLIIIYWGENYGI